MTQAPETDAPAGCWRAALGWALVSPGLGQLYQRRPLRAVVVCGALWLLLALITTSAHRMLHRPGLLLLLAGVLLLIWTLGLFDALRLARARMSQGPPLRWNACLGVGLGHWYLLLNLLLPPGVAWVPAVPDLIVDHPTDQNAVSGAGGLTAGLSASGVLTLLRWPGPAGRDHVDWRAVPDRPAGLGAEDSMGVFAGVVVDGAVHWFRDATFETHQRYLSDASDLVVTEHVSEELGLQATETLFVRPDQDLLVWHVELTRQGGGPAEARVVWFENLAPCTWKLPYVAISDWALDQENDFAAAYHEDDDVIVHLAPRGEPARPDAPDGASAWIDALDTTYEAGVTFALGTQEPSSWAQVGPDDPEPGAPAEWVRQAGAERFAAGAAVAALARDLDLSSGRAEATLYLAAGATLDGPGGARSLMRRARLRGYAAHRAESLDEWERWLSRARLPATDDPHVRRLAKRSLMVLRNACDRPSGAMVASVAGQLPYALDWTRDGAFLNLALDEAGFPELVTRHNAYYARVQRDEGLLAGTFPMNTYEDGTPGGPIFLEIDNAALATWTLADHARFLPDVERQAYLQEVSAAIQRGAEFLVRWRDPWSLLPLPANEDDNPAFSRGIQATVTAILALRAAEEVGPALRVPPAQLTTWRDRRAELGQALFESYWDNDAGRLADGGPKELDASAWALWPCAVFDEGDPRAESQGRYLWGELQRTLSGDKTRSGYDAKLFLALATLWGPDHPQRSDLVAAYRQLALKLPTPGTGLLGEHCRIRRQPNGEVSFENLNNMPHVWEHALHYLTALRLFPPAPR